MQDIEPPAHYVPTVISSNHDPEEARLEAKEASKYLLAKSYFDCREYERCAAVFLPANLPRSPLSATSPNTQTRTPARSAKGKGRDPNNAKTEGVTSTRNIYPKLSQKSLFLALYAKYISGEKRKDEDSEMILGPADGGTTVNKELIGLGRGLEGWLTERAIQGKDRSSQGWLEYLYGIVLAKGKTEEDAKRWLIRSVHLCPYNWGAWLELSELLGKVDEVGRAKPVNGPMLIKIYIKLQSTLPELPKNIMTLIFHLHASQELYQSTEQTHQQLTELENIFPKSQFLKTERALLFYHSKGAK